MISCGWLWWIISQVCQESKYGDITAVFCYPEGRVHQNHIFHYAAQHFRHANDSGCTLSHCDRSNDVFSIFFCVVAWAFSQLQASQISFIDSKIVLPPVLSIYHPNIPNKGYIYSHLYSADLLEIPKTDRVSICVFIENGRWVAFSQWMCQISRDLQSYISVCALLPQTLLLNAVYHLLCACVLTTWITPWHISV